MELVKKPYKILQAFIFWPGITRHACGTGARLMTKGITTNKSFGYSCKPYGAYQHTNWQWSLRKDLWLLWPYYTKGQTRKD